MNFERLKEITIIIKGAGEQASGIAWTLHQAGLKKIVLLEMDSPLAVRRRVSFCEAVPDGRQTVEGVTALRVADGAETAAAWKRGCLAVRVDPGWRAIGELKPRVVIDAILAKRNLGTHRAEADLVIGLGPGFTAGEDVHRVIETQRGHHLARIIFDGPAAPNSGVPGSIGGHTTERVLRAPADGVVLTRVAITDRVSAGQTVLEVAGIPVKAGIDGVVRGLIRDARRVPKGLKIGDIDPRFDVGYCNTISEKARAIGAAALLAIMNRYTAGQSALRIDE
ncbi:MAG: selenium-dependent molybdenum cofactor biosynthesis protein YqeB [Desulfosarcinaceae bacterium]